VLAPANFGAFGNAVLVGNFNFGDPASGPGTFSAFDPVSGQFLGLLRSSEGNPIWIDGLWSLAFGNGGKGGATNTLYFTAGIQNEKHGLFGSISQGTIAAGLTPVMDPDNGHYYLQVHVPGGLTWGAARDAAASLSYAGRQGHLVTITSDAEQQFVANRVEPAPPGVIGWIGGYKDASGVRHWVTGEPFVYQHWFPQQPPKPAGALDHGQPADYLQIYSNWVGNGVWNDTFAANLDIPGYVVEFE